MAQGVLGGLLGGSGAGTGTTTGAGGGLLDLLGRASDSSLDKLAVPGAFYNDAAIRIALPLLGGAGGTLGSLLNGASRLGIADGLVRKLNDAAGLAAKEAKPIFRSAISRLSITDVPGIVGQNDGASQYLRRSAGTELTGKLRPLIDAALGKVNAFSALDSLSRRSPLLAQAGISRSGLGASVTDQALNGIFKYIGAEEGRLRGNPVGAVSGVLGGLLKN
ncbi:MAG: DUF4197 domain-containing protein [Sphingomonadales bacterium]|nr:DUF4197 domain-containing protein [Sphingomonadales bacterium]